MARFIVRRSLSAIALLLATSFLVFAFFELIPSYNPAREIAGRNANQTTVNEVARKFDFNKPFYVVLNLAAGGSWAGAPDETTPFPATMLVDWVHWQPA